MDNLLEQLEQWNKNDEFSRCIEAIEAIPEKERGYKLTVLLGRAYSNLAVLGDHKAHGDDDEVDKELIQHSIDILETVWKQGENDPYWNARMGYVYLWDYRDCALAVLKDHTWNSIEEEEAAYLLLPYTEESYQAISAILDKRLKEFLETEFEDDPELRVARAADGKPPIIPDWDGPLFCYATDRIAQKGYKIKGAKRIMPEREEWGWESGWGFFSDDDMMDDELDDEKAGFYDIRDICRIDPTVVSLLSLPYGTYMEKNETGEWVEIEDDETELMTMQLDKIEDVLSENLGEGYRIVRDNDELSPIIEWVDWVNQSENDENEEAIRVEVHFEDGTEETFEKGITLRQIWHEDVL